MAGADAKMPTMAASASALGRGVRTGLDRPGDACHLISRAGGVVDVTRDAGDVAAHIELDFVRSIGNALVLHVEAYVLGKIEACSLSRRAGILFCLIGANLKIDGVLGRARLCVLSCV